MNTQVMKGLRRIFEKRNWFPTLLPGSKRAAMRLYREAQRELRRRRMARKRRRGWA